MIEWLTNWYLSNCDGEWEHGYGISIETVDNPGWIIKVDTVYTNCFEKPFLEIRKDNGDNDWIICHIQDNKFFGAGDPTKLEEILRIFREWVES